MTNTVNFSVRFTVRKLTEADVPSVLALCRENMLYYQHCPPFVTEGSILSDMKALPPGKTLEDKYYLGYFDGGRMIAVMDYIHAFPNGETDFIGFFMVSMSSQKKGVGSGIIQELCAYLPEEWTKAIRLGWVQGNPQAEHFWKKNGFWQTGVTSKTDHYMIVYAEKSLTPKSVQPERIAVSAEPEQPLTAE